MLVLVVLFGYATPIQGMKFMLLLVFWLAGRDLFDEVVLLVGFIISKLFEVLLWFTAVWWLLVNLEESEVEPTLLLV